MKERIPAEVPVISRLFGVPDSHKLDVYLHTTAIKALERALKIDAGTGDRRSEEIRSARTRRRGLPHRDEVELCPKEAAKPKYIVCNADESEPGTCKDRPLMEMDPHQLIEGMVIAGHAVGSHRDTSIFAANIATSRHHGRRMAEAYARGYLGKNIQGSGFDFDLVTHTGAGAYECGEETALMESLEGKRGYPRIRPPFPAVVGPVRSSDGNQQRGNALLGPGNSAASGGEWYAGLGSPKNGGTRLFCMSGHVNKPGIYELPMGFPLRRMIEEVAGGVLGGKKAESRDSRRKFLPAAHGR